MNIVLLFLIFSVIVIDFLSFHKHDFKTVVVYLGIVSLILLVSILDKYDILEFSPVEAMIDTLTPLVEWISESLRTL